MNPQGKKPTPASPPSPVSRRLRFDRPHPRPVRPPYLPTGQGPRDGR